MTEDHSNFKNETGQTVIFSVITNKPAFNVAYIEIHYKTLFGLCNLKILQYAFDAFLNQHLKKRATTVTVNLYHVLSYGVNSKNAISPPVPALQT